MQERSRTPDCLDDETLAAYVDGGLTADERSRVQLHLAACQDCFAVFTETVKTVQTMREAGEFEEPGTMESAPRSREAATVVPIVVAPRRRLARWATVGVGLAAAAAVVLAVWWSRPAVQTNHGSEIAELVAAIGSERPFEPRLNGGFAYGRYAPTRGLAVGPASPEVRIAVARLEQRLRREKSAAANAAFGAAALFDGRTDDAIRAFEESLRQRPGDPAVNSDLSAAWLVKADHAPERREEYAAKALEYATRSIERAPDLPEAWFNRGLALEALGDGAAAVSAWERYLAVETDSGWLAEARAHLERLRTRPAAEDRSVNPDSLTRDSRSGPRQDELLLQWARSERARPGSGRDTLIELCTLVRNEASGSARVVPTRDVLGWCSKMSPSVLESAAVASGIVALSEARSALSTDQLPQARRAALDALSRLPKSWPSPRARALLVLATADYWDRVAVPSRLMALATEVQGSADEALRAEQSMLEALWKWQALQPEQALAGLDRAARSFHVVGEVAGEYRARRAKSALLRILGAHDSAWDSLAPALRDPVTVTRPMDRYLTLSTAGLLALDMDAPRAALAFQDRAVQVVESARIQGPLIEALCGRAAMHLELGSPARGRTDLDRASRLLTVKADAYLDAECSSTDAVLQLEHDPRGAAARLTRVLDAFDTKESPLTPYLRVLRARAWRRLSEYQRARLDLDSAIRVLERQGRDLPQDDLRARLSHRSGDVYDEASDLQLSSFGDGEQALAYLERGRLQEASAGHRSPTSFELSRVRRALTPGVVIVSYNLRDDELVVWILEHSGCATYRDRQPRRAVVERIEAVVRSPLTPSPELGYLSDLLLRHVPMSSQRIVFVPDEELARVPFSVLRAARTDRLLIEDHTVLVAPAVGSMFQDTSQRRWDARTLRLLSVGTDEAPRTIYPGLRRLRFAEQEARQVARFYGTALSLTGQDSSVERVTRELGSSDVFHFAGHALVNDVAPSLSSLLLRADSEGPAMLPAGRIARLNLTRMRLAVLSGCSTAGGRVARGEGVVGLARAFLRAGASDVVATLWDVSDGDVRPFMEAFHEHYVRGGDAAAALRRAQLNQLHAFRAGTTDATDWAAFVVIGTTLHTVS